MYEEQNILCQNKKKISCLFVFETVCFTTKLPDDRRDVAKRRIVKEVVDLSFFGPRTLCAIPLYVICTLFSFA